MSTANQQDLNQQLLDIETSAKNSFNQAQNMPELEQAKALFFGKQSPLTELLKSLAQKSHEEKKTAGAQINQTKQNIEALLNHKKDEILEAALLQKLNAEKIDISLAGVQKHRGSLHPVMQTWQEIQEIFHSIGFDVADGPEIENDWFNFSALNSPKNHPARSMQDTFYVDINDDEAQPLLLRTHTSPIQVRYACKHQQKVQAGELSADAEVRIIAPGRTYRVDSDATHSPMFHQVEGLWIGKNISFADLKGVYTYFLRTFFKNDAIEVRFRPSYFPFTEPSAEIDMSFGQDANQQTKWLEISGAGQVHPQVLQNMGIDSEAYMGFAFGSGLERLTMLKYGIQDLRLFFEGDVRFLKNFNF